MEKLSAEKGMALTEVQVIALEKVKEEKFAIGEINTHHPSNLEAQGTHYIGAIRG